MAKELETTEIKVRDPGKLTLADVVTPIFDLKMGQRLALARMQRFWHQKDLAEKLGMSTETIRRIEAGTLAVPRYAPSVSRLEDVFGELAVKYILLDKYGATYSEPAIRSKFWGKVYRNRKAKPKGEHWTRQRIREGKPVQGHSFQGIPGDIWDTAVRLHKEKEAKNKRK